MPSPGGTSLEEGNKTLIRSFTDEIFNEHNLSSIEEYFGIESVEGSPQAGKSGEGFKQFLSEFFKAFPDWHVNIEHIVAENNLVVVFLNCMTGRLGRFYLQASCHHY
jgi:predicted SnoaL-like aldol condensation-catalyzing enzyme